MNIFGWFRPSAPVELPPAAMVEPSGDPSPKAQAVARTSGGYRGAGHERGMTHWDPFGTSATASTPPLDRKRITARSRDLFRNAPIARGVVTKDAAKVIGTGIVYQSRIDYEALGITQEQAQAWQKKAEREFRLFAKHADIRRQMSEYGLQHLFYLTATLSGDVFISCPRVPRPGAVYDTRIQILEGDRVSNPTGKQDSTNLVQGVQLDEYGAPTGYWVCNQHPGDTNIAANRKWISVPAYGKNTGRRTANLAFFVERPEQYRGLSMLAPLIAPLQKLDKFSDATLMNAIVSSLFAVFLTVPEGGSGLPGVGGNFTSAEGSNEDQSAESSSVSRVEMGTGNVLECPPGYEPKFASPSNPSPNFDPFFQAYVRQMAMAINRPYEVVLGHYSSSYTAAKAAFLDAATAWNRSRQWMRESYNEFVVEAFMDESVEKGRLVAPGYFEDPAIREAYLGADFIGDVYGSLDMLKEMQAYKLAIDERLMSRTRAMAELNGGDWDANVAQMAKEQKDLAAAGILPVAQPGAITPQAPADDGKTNATKNTEDQ